MSLQFEVAFSTLVDFYGEPKWEENPKVGQSREQIIKIWESELKDYSESQVREACYKLFRFRKAMTFPTISHLKAMLFDEEPNYEPEKKEPNNYSCPEIDLYEECGSHCIFGKFRYAFQKMVEDFKAFNPESDRMTFADGSLVKAMQNNGWWSNKIGEYLK